MLFVLHALDKPGHGHVRKANMDAHVAYLRTKPIKLVLAGPLLDPEGAPVGSMLVVEAEDLAQVTRFTQEDPTRKPAFSAPCRYRPIARRSAGINPSKNASACWRGD
jgi:uncharacterized protein